MKPKIFYIKPSSSLSTNRISKGYLTICGFGKKLFLSWQMLEFQLHNAREKTRQFTSDDDVSTLSRIASQI